MSSVIESNKGDIGHVHVLYGVKFNGEIDIVQFIFTPCVVYSFEQKLSLNEKVEKEMKGMTAPIQKITWCVIYFY